MNVEALGSAAFSAAASSSAHSASENLTPRCFRGPAPFVGFGFLAIPDPYQSAHMWANFATPTYTIGVRSLNGLNAEGDRMPKTIRFVSVAIGQQCVCQGQDRPHSHVVAIDVAGRLWERFSDMPAGEWGQIEGPDAADASKTRGRKR